MSVNRPVPSTGDVTAPAPGPHLRPGGLYPSHRHHGGLCAAAHHNHVGSSGLSVAAAQPAAPPDPLPAPSPRDFAVFPPASTVGPLEHWPTGNTSGPGLGAGDPQGARGDTLSAAASSSIGVGAMGCGRDLRDRPQPAELALPRRRLPGRHRLLVRHLGLVEAERGCRSWLRGRRSSTSLGAGCGGSVGTGSPGSLGLLVPRQRVVDSVSA